MKRLLTFLFALPAALLTAQQNPFEELGYDPRIATLSGGKYIEYFDRDSIVQIGSIVYNISSRKIIGFVKEDTTRSEATLQPDIVSRWIAPDPMAYMRSWVSPYNFVQNSPVIRIDPNGALDAPIYDIDGNFLGTDDEGLQGKAIVMNKSDFTQGMTHSDALNKNRGAQGFSSSTATSDFLSHYNGLKNRPDYDGYLTFEEATDWSNKGGGEPLFVDAGKIDLSPKTIKDVQYAAKNNSGYIDFFADGAGDLNTGRVYGNIKVTLDNPKTGDVTLGGSGGFLDIHDFKNPVFRTINDWLSSGTPTDYEIFCAPCQSKVKLK